MLSRRSDTGSRLPDCGVSNSNTRHERAPKQRPLAHAGVQPPCARAKSKARPTSGRRFDDCDPNVESRPPRAPPRPRHNPEANAGANASSWARIRAPSPVPRRARPTKSERGGRATRDRVEPSTNQLRPPSGGLMSPPRGHEPHSRLTRGQAVSTIAGQTPTALDDRREHPARTCGRPLSPGGSRRARAGRWRSCGSSGTSGRLELASGDARMCLERQHFERLIGCSWRGMRGYVPRMLKRYAWIVYFAILVLAPLSVLIALEWLPWPAIAGARAGDDRRDGVTGARRRASPFCDSTIGGGPAETTRNMRALQAELDERDDPCAMRRVCAASHEARVEASSHGDPVGARWPCAGAVSKVGRSCGADGAALAA